jgi:hypothetical protein
MLKLVAAGAGAQCWLLNAGAGASYRMLVLSVAFEMRLVLINAVKC